MQRAFSLWPALLTGGFTFALGAAVSDPAPSKPAAPVSPQFVTYDAGAAEWLNAPRTVSMSKGVTFTQNDAVLKTDAAVANLDDKQNLLNAESKGPVHLYDSQNDLTGKQGFVDFTKHLAKLQNDITLVVKPGASEADAPAGSLRSRFKDAATMTCQELTYDYRRKFGRVPGPLTVRQVIQQKTGPLTRTLTADAGEYDGRAQTVTLIGNVQGRDSDGNIIRASTKGSGKPVVIGIKEGAEFIRIPFPTTGTLPVKNEDDAPDDSTSPAIPPPPLTNRPASGPLAPENPLTPNNGGTGEKGRGASPAPSSSGATP